MREKLPPYIVECLIVSCFDAIDSIVEIYMEDGPKNLIELIETYIEKLVLLHINEQAVFASGIITPFVSP